MLTTNNAIKNSFVNYSNKDTKLSREVKNKKYIKVVNGLYETNPNVLGYYLAGAIYGPSYLSFDFALAYYGLIPEQVKNYTSATFNKKKKKTYKNAFGIYLYRDVPKKAYPYGIDIISEGNYSYQIATKEKALCDKLYTLSPVNNLKQFEELLFDDLRIDKYELSKFNLEDVEFLEKKYHTTNVTFLYKYLRRKKNE